MTKPHINHHHHPMQGCEVNHDALVNDVSTLTDPRTGLLQQYKGIKYRIHGGHVLVIGVDFGNGTDHTPPLPVPPEQKPKPEQPPYFSDLLNHIIYSLPDDFFLSVFHKVSH